MSEFKPGTIGWHDLTVDNADDVRQFYSRVVGWKTAPVSMGDYDDYNMLPPGDDNPVAGVCHKRGSNSDMPSQWMMYVIVEKLDHALSECRAAGGKLVTDVKSAGEMGRFCVIEDPAGAVLALFEPKQ